MVFTGFAELFTDMGLSTALVQRQSIENRHLSSVFWINVVIGLTLTLVLLFLSPYVSRFYDEPRLMPLMAFISLSFLLGSFCMVQRALYIRAMNFRFLFFTGLGINLICGTLAITMSLLGFGVWSLAWQSLMGITLFTLFAWYFSAWKPSLSFDFSALKDLIPFSANLLGFNIFSYWARNLDSFLVGKFFGARELGIYGRAYNIMLLPLYQISWVVGQAMLPSLSKIQNDKEAVKQIYLKAINVIALVTFPMMSGLFVVADSFILTLLGRQWTDVIPVLRILCFLGIVQSITTTIGWIYTSQGRTDIQLRWGLISGSLIIGSIAVGIAIGSIVAVAFCCTIMSTVILLYPTFAIPGRLIGMRFSDVMAALKGVAVCSIGMALGIFILGLLLPTGCPHWLQLLIKVTSGIIIYIFLIHWSKLDAYFKVLEILSAQWTLIMRKK